jgi:hypothetical protein
MGFIASHLFLCFVISSPLDVSRYIFLWILPSTKINYLDKYMLLKRVIHLVQASFHLKSDYRGIKSKWLLLADYEYYSKRLFSQVVYKIWGKWCSGSGERFYA